jgi:ribosomal protein S18 acetylase RimI-like enzyme
VSRQAVTMRQATAGDVPFLLEIWGDEVLRKADRQEQVADLEGLVKESLDSAEQRLLIADYDGQPAGAVLLQVATLSPLNLDQSLHALAPHVASSYRRRGIGKALMNAAVTWAEELGIPYISTAVAPSSRAANRFMVRLSLGPQAVHRVAPTPAVRAQLSAMLPTAQRTSGRMSGRRHLGQVLAARRQLSRRTTEDLSGS